MLFKTLNVINILNLGADKQPPSPSPKQKEPFFVSLSSKPQQNGIFLLTQKWEAATQKSFPSFSVLFLSLFYEGMTSIQLQGGRAAPMAQS